jgi:uncharacterized protein
MLLVKNYVFMSRIHGWGLFAREDIPAGSRIWAFKAECDEVISLRRFADLPVLEKKRVQHFGYLNPATEAFIVSRDGARFINHSSEPNVITIPCIGSSEGVDIALIDIAHGQELTMDYSRFDADFRRKLLIRDSQQVCAADGIL